MTTALRCVVCAVLAALLIGCGSSRSFDRSADGEIRYLDTMTDAERAAARTQIVNGLQKGLGAYRLAVGDRLEILFHIYRVPTEGEYLISVGDDLLVEFVYNADLSRTVKVRPDGRISLPTKGSIFATGLTADGLAATIQNLYRDILANPVVEVNVVDYRSMLDEFVETIESAQGGRGKTVVVAPDGGITLPLLAPVQAAGATSEVLKENINAAYAAQELDVKVSVLLSSFGGDRVVVFGEVLRPGPIQASGPQTALLAVASAGGVLPTGAVDQVRLFYISETGEQRVRQINLYNVLNGLQLEEDMVLPHNSVVYVPPTALALAGRFVDQTLRDILLFNGFSAGLSFIYDLRGTGSISTGF